MYKKLLAVKMCTLLVLISIIQFNQAMLLKCPPSITNQEIEDLLQKDISGMSFRILDQANKFSGSCNFTWNKKALFIGLYLLGQWPKELDQQLQEKCKKIIQNETQIGWSFSSPESPIPSTTKITNLHQQPASIPLFQARNNSPQRLTTMNDLANLISSKKVALYTGAGLSAPAVYTLDQLWANLSLTDPKKTTTDRVQKERYNLFEAILTDAEPIRKTMHSFYTSCFFSEPTKAHQSIATLCKNFGWGLITENIDLLHQRTGLNPVCYYRCNPAEASLLKLITKDEVEKIDYLLIIGQSCDNSGLIYGYKKVNPKGIVVGFNLGTPPYLEETDYLVQGDIQETIPELETRLSSLLTE